MGMGETSPRISEVGTFRQIRLFNQLNKKILFCLDEKYFYHPVDIVYVSFPLVFNQSAKVKVVEYFFLLTRIFYAKSTFSTYFRSLTPTGLATPIRFRSIYAQNWMPQNENRKFFHQQ